jgi:DNA-binding transcriptional MerR regulator
MARRRTSITGHTARRLSTLTGVSARTLRSWIAQGVLPKPQGKGRGARYSDTHVQVARAVLGLRRQGVALSQMSLRLAQLDKQQLERLAQPVNNAPAERPAPPEPSYPFARWEVVELMPGLALIVSPEKGPVLRRVADEIYRHYSAKSN